jgi:hypothetical protein
MKPRNSYLSAKLETVCNYKCGVAKRMHAMKHYLRMSIGKKF